MEETSEVKSRDLEQVIDRLLTAGVDYGESVVLNNEQLFVAQISCPEVLLPFCKSSEILLVQKFKQKHLTRFKSIDESSVQNNNNDFIINSTPAKSQRTSEDLDITGSPLKCPFTLNDDTTDFSPFSVSLHTSNNKNPSLSYTPLSSSKAGIVASQFNLKLSRMAARSDFLPIWVVCDGRDAQGLLLYGLQRTEKLASRTVVTVGGPYIGSENLPSLSHLQNNHTTSCPTTRVDCKVEATYDVLSTGEGDEGSSVRLLCSWKRPLAMLVPPVRDADTTVSLKVVCSDPRSAAYQIHLELNLVKELISGLSTGEVAWFVRQEPKTVAEDLQNLFASIKDKGTSEKKGNVPSEKRDDGASDFDKMMEGKFNSRRQNMDFTDLLWTVMSKSESYKELKDSLHMMFEAVSGGQVRPQIHVRNATQVGTLARSIMRGQAGVPELSGLTPLTMLVEMGIQKIRKDYISIFQACDLATSEQLSSFVGSSEDSVETSVIQLQRLHVALQAVVILRINLNLPPVSLVHFTAQMLNQLQGTEPSASHFFTYKLDTATVHTVLNRLKPTTWEVSFHSSHGSFEKSMICHVSQHPLIQLSSDVADLEETLESSKRESEDNEEKYYCSFIKTVTDEIFA